MAGTAGTNNDGTLTVEPGNTVTVTYRDQLDSVGNTVDRTDTGTVDADTDGDGSYDDYNENVDCTELGDDLSDTTL